MAAFATPADLATYLKRDLSAAEESAATLILDLASAAIRTYTGQTISAVEGDTVTLDPPRWPSSLLSLPQLPVTAVTSVTVAGTLHAPITDYYWYGPEGMIEFVSRSLGSLRQSVVVVYDHGYATSSPELGVAQGVCLAIAKRTMESAGVDVKGESIGNYAYTAADVHGSLYAPDPEAEGWRSSLMALRPLVFA